MLHSTNVCTLPCTDLCTLHRADFCELQSTNVCTLYCTNLCRLHHTDLLQTSVTSHRLQFHHTDFPLQTSLCYVAQASVRNVALTALCYTGETSVCYISQTVPVTPHSPSTCHRRDFSTVHCADVAPQISVRCTSHT